MKKLFPGILALMLAFGCLAGCGNPDAPDTGSNPPDSTPVAPAHQHDKDLKDVKDYLSEQLKSKNLNTNRTFTMPSTFSFTGETVVYDVAWSVDKTDVVTITAGESEDTFTIADLDEDTPFVLTATITDPENCHTTTFTLDGVALKAVLPVAIDGKPAENIAFKLHVYQATKEVDCYFTGEMDDFYFATTYNYEEGIDLYVEHIADSDAFNVYFTDADDTKQYIGVQEGWNSKKSYWTFNVVFDTTAPSSFVWNDDYDTITTTVPCRSDADKENKEATQTSTKTLYLGNYNTYTTFSASTLDKAATSNVGNLVVMTAKKDIVIPDTKKVADVKAGLTVQADHKMNKELTLATGDSRYDDVTITWAVEADKGAVLNGNKLALTIPATATTVTLTATIACGETTDTKEFTLNLGPAIVLGDNPTSAEIVAAAFELENGEELGEFTLEGVISKVKTAYDTGYKNVTVVITVEGKEIECFRMKGEGADVIKAGDTINVTGKLKNYNGTVEFDSGCKLNSYVAGTETPPAGGTEEPTGNSVTAPVAGTAYNMYLEQNGANKVLYLTGVMSGNYLATTTDATQAADLYVEVATGGFYLYFLGADNAKSYITLTERQDGNYWKASVSLTTEGTTVFQYNQAGCWAATLTNETFFLGTYGTYETISASSSFYMKDFGTAQYPALICADGGITTTTPPAGGNGGTETPPAGDEATLIASINMMGSTNKVSITDTQTVYQANGITYTNDKSSSRTNNSNYNPTTYAMRAYQGSKITISSTTAFTKVVFTLDDYENGKYLLGFDGMTIAGATITRNNDVVTITFDTAVTEFSTTDLPSQVRIEKIDLY